mmetsp:Transcript_14876/g.19758  ORF Transcript_14876/g.19758 Transcript_14876/m.19758 type:complete len:82 (-) Transcript_14876:45-290(-)
MHDCCAPWSGVREKAIVVEEMTAVPRVDGIGANDHASPEDDADNRAARAKGDAFMLFTFTLWLSELCQDRCLEMCLLSSSI